MSNNELDALLDGIEIEEVELTAVEYKEIGNANFKNRKYAAAIDAYSNAIKVDPRDHLIYSNRSAAYLAGDSAQLALEDAMKCIELKADWAKGYSRKGAALYALRDYAGALEAYTAGSKLDGNDKGCLDGIASMQKHLPKIKRDKREAFVSKVKIPGRCSDKWQGGCSDRGRCTHPYLDKWDGEYVCKFCRYQLKLPDDADRIASETEKEAETPRDEIPPGLSESEREDHIGMMSQARGVSIGFLLALTSKYNCWKWTAWDIINKIVMPATEESRRRYMELDEMSGNVGPASTFISYAQAGDWGDVMAALLDGDADLSRFAWIDIMCVRQWPSDSPDLNFASTIRHCDSFLCVCSYVKSVESIDVGDLFQRKVELISESERKKIAFLRVWCLVEIAAAALKAGMTLVMKCGNHVIDSSDGSVRFESKADVLYKLSMLVDISKAEATVASDKARILQDIEQQQSGGIEHLNQVIRGVLTGAFFLARYGDKGSTVQCAACGDADAISIVLSDPTSYTPIVAVGGYLALLRQLLERRADVKDWAGTVSTAMMRASGGGHQSCMEVLIASGADVNAKNNDGGTAMMIASHYKHVAAVEVLKRHGAVS